MFDQGLTLGYDVIKKEGYTIIWLYSKYQRVQASGYWNLKIKLLCRKALKCDGNVDADVRVTTIAACTFVQAS